MYKMKLTYEDFNGNEQTEELRFNLTETEMLDIMKEDPDFDPGRLMGLDKDKDGLKLLDLMRKVIALSYGEMSEDGKYFKKDAKRTENFVQSAMFNQLMNNIISSTNLDFVNELIMGIIPKKLMDRLMKSDQVDPKVKQFIAASKK